MMHDGSQNIPLFFSSRPTIRHCSDPPMGLRTSDFVWLERLFLAVDFGGRSFPYTFMYMYIRHSWKHGAKGHFQWGRWDSSCVGWSFFLWSIVNQKKGINQAFVAVEHFVDYDTHTLYTICDELWFSLNIHIQYPLRVQDNSKAWGHNDSSAFYCGERPFTKDWNPRRLYGNDFMIAMIS